MKQPFSIIYRPQTFNEVFGNKAAINSLKNKIKKGNHHTYLLSGIRGCGKTTLARICANILGSGSIKEYNSADVGIKDFARKLIGQSNYRSWDGTPISIILDEIQETKSGFQDAMLKLFEDSPSHYYWFLCTTNPEKLKKAVKSRCSQHTVNPLNKEESKQLIRSILEKENKRLRSNIIDAIVENTEGIPREIVILLEDTLDMDNDDLRLEKINSIKTNPESEAKELFKVLLDGKWGEVQRVLRGLKNTEAENYRRYLLACYSNKISWSKNQDYIRKLISQAQYFKENFFDSGFYGLQEACFDAYEEIN